MMFVLTRKEDDVDSGTYATLDEDGDTIIQMFVDKDDAITYTVHLEALDQSLFVTEVDSESVEKLCSVTGHAYSVVEPGEVVIPKMETLVNTLDHDHLQQTDI